MPESQRRPKLVLKVERVWDDDGMAVVEVKIGRCDGCFACSRTPVPEDFLAMPDPAPVCARCLHPLCKEAGL